MVCQDEIEKVFASFYKRHGYMPKMTAEATRAELRLCFRFREVSAIGDVSQFCQECLADYYRRHGDSACRSGSVADECAVRFGF